MSFRPHLNFNIAFLNAAEGHPIIENKLPLKLPKKLLIIFFYNVEKYLVKKHILNGSGNECVWLRNNYMYVKTERLDWAHK